MRLTSAAVVAFPPVLVPLLDQHLAKHVREEPDALVFTGRKGARLRRNNFGKLVGWSNVVADARCHRAALSRPAAHGQHVRGQGPGTTIRDLMGRMRHDSTRAALIYLHGGARADRVIANALPVDLGIYEEDEQ